MHHHVAFGLRWVSDVPLEHFTRCDSDGCPADIMVRRATGPLPDRDDILTIDNASLCTDGVRFHAGDDAIFDLHASGRIDWWPGSDWTGHFPPVFYGTLAALLLAWRGAMPIHASSVEMNGRAFLICGASGAGKSTLAAALVAMGAARLIADDLTVLATATPDGPPIVHAGRPAIRLFPAIAEHLRLGASLSAAPDSDKQLVLPPQIDPFTAIPLAAIIFLGADVQIPPVWQRSALLDAQIFRPRWLRAIPGWPARFHILHRAASTLPMLSFPPLTTGNPPGIRAWAEQALQRMTSSHFR